EMPGVTRVWWLATQGRHRVCLRCGERIGRPCILPRRVEPGLEECADAALEAAQDLSHVLIGQAGKWHESDDAFFTDPNAVRDHAMEVDVQVQRAAEALHEKDPPAPAAANCQPAAAQ